MHDSYSGPSSIHPNAQGLGGRKRKRGQVDLTPLDSRPIQIHHAAGSAIALESTFRPIKTIPRAHLPLSYLQPTQIAYKRFQSHIACLETSSGSQELEAKVLIVEDPEKVLHAIERIYEKEYAVCRLAAHVTLELLGSWPGSCTLQRPRPITSSNSEWWVKAAVASPASGATIGDERTSRLDMLVKTATSQVACTQQQPQTLTETQAETNSKLQDIEQETPVVDIDELLTTFIQHYLDMLYKSKTSVAYFAKAHVPRLRAGLTAQGDDGKERLADFLAGMILSSSTFDKKHKNLWPEKAKDILPSAALRSPESQDKNASVKKVRKKRAKVKPDKTGCLVDEEGHFTYWWLHDDDVPASNETIESRYKRRSLGLRTREAFLQVIIMLELASLQMSVPGRPGGADATGTEGKSSKSSKSKDYTMALELLVDKLCIWHSIDNGLLVTPDADGKESQPKKAPDQLRNFCVEVIVPFYMSKAPDVASNINKKLGGPVAPSPSKRRSATTTDSSKRLSRTDREPLERVPSDRQTHKRRAMPSLARSATDSQLVPGLKREPSEISLDSIPLKAEVKADSRRSSLLDKMRLRQREVDFDAMSQVQESKRKKQAEVENKLKEAISALKKPNRVLAGRELADVAEQRELMAQAREKASKAQRARQRQQIQVESTPKRNRQRTDLITATPQAKHSTDNRQQHSASTVSMIPSSGIRVSDELEVENSILDTGHRPRHLQIDATPVQGMKKFPLPGLPQSAIKQPVFGSASTSNVMETPVKKGVGGGGAQEIESGSLTLGPSSLATPIKSRWLPENEAPTGVGVAETPNAHHAKVSEGDVDIYAALGWDD